MTGSKLDLTDEERRALLLFIQAALVEPKYPLSPEVEALRRVAENLSEGGKRHAHGDERLPRAIRQNSDVS